VAKLLVCEMELFISSSRTSAWTAVKHVNQLGHITKMTPSSRLDVDPGQMPFENGCGWPRRNHLKV